MLSKIEQSHRKRSAYIYIRQSTMGQVRNHQESTERQYALKDKASNLGWIPEKIRIMDRDLGKSGSQSTDREDFKTLVTDISMGRVGALFVLEASRLARSSLDWQHLIELCSLTGTLVIDEDGCYDPGDFNDGLLLGIKGTIAQAELHFIRLRLQGGKLNKAQKGELRLPLPVGLLYNEEGQIALDPDQEVQGALRLVFSAFKTRGSAYGVVQEFVCRGLEFPKRFYGGVWNGKLMWSRLRHERVICILKNPFYAGAYVFGRNQCVKTVSSDGVVRCQSRTMPMEQWRVIIHNHHKGYISWEEYLENQKTLQKNRTNSESTLLSGPVREGFALLQGLLMCSICGHRIIVQYTGNQGIYPMYQCVWRKREGLSPSSCITIRSDPIDKAVSKRVLEVIEPKQIEIALKAIEELEKMDEAVQKQWQMRISRCEYEAQLAEKRYTEVDPSNRLVASTLEQRWNDALVKLEESKCQYEEFQNNELHVPTREEREKVIALAQDFPLLWNAPTTSAKDKKRILRLLIKDISIKKVRESKEVILQIRWQGGACESFSVEIATDHLKYSEKFVEKVRQLAKEHSDAQVASILSEEGHLSCKGKALRPSMINWIRNQHKIPLGLQKNKNELSVTEVSERFNVSKHVVYYWIDCGILKTRQLNGRNSQHWITIDSQKEKELLQYIENSSKLYSSSRCCNT
jgi:DNA invertase Pin-like site-specific DNA recombinase